MLRFDVFCFTLQTSILLHFFCHQDGVQGGTSKQLITTDKEFQSLVTKGNRLADTSNLDIVLACGGQGHGVAQVVGVIHNLDSLGFLQHLAGNIDIDVLFGLQNDGLGVGSDGGDANGGTTDGGIFGQSANLAAFPSDLHFFLGVSVLLEFVNLWNDIEGQGVGKNVIGDILVVQIGLGTFGQFIHARLPGTGRGLVGAHQHPDDTKFLDEGPKCHEANGGGTVGVGNQLGFFGFVTVDFGYDKWNIGFVTEGGLLSL